MWRSRIALALAVALALGVQGAAAERYGLGRPVSPEELKGWDIDVMADGRGLPPGRGSVAEGQLVFAAQWAACHGDKGEGRRVEGAAGGFDRLVGGVGSLGTKSPVQTVGSFWPYATTLFDYVRRAMPFHAPQSLPNDEVYAVSAYVLHLNGIGPADAVLDETTLAAVRMPNRGGFTAEDPRPDIKSKP